jgi:hypothetical protein
MMNRILRDQFASLSARRDLALGAARRAGTALGALAFVVLSPQIARADLNLSDTTFTPANWQTNVFASPAPGTVAAATILSGGTNGGQYRRVTDVVAGLGGVAIGLQLYVAPGSAIAGPITSIDGSIRYKCITCPAPNGVAFGLAIMQKVGNNVSYYRAAQQIQGLTLQSTAWSGSPFTQTGLTSNDFDLMNSDGTWNVNVHPNFTNPDIQTSCGFYTGNSSPKGVGGYTSVAGFDDWTCVIHTPKIEMARVKICKVAGPGIPVGTTFKFSAGPFSGLVPAGPAPGGYCVLGPSVPVGTSLNVQEGVPQGVSVSSITVEPANRLLGSDLGMGIAKVTAGSGVTEVTFTNQRKTDGRTGYLEICKAGDVKGNFVFTVSPGLGPFTVPAGACSPAIQVTAGNVVISEAPNAFGITGSATFPASRQGPWNTHTSTVTVVPGDISTQTVVTITNGKPR